MNIEQKLLYLILPHLTSRSDELRQIVNTDNPTLKQKIALADILTENKLILGYFIDKSVGVDWHPMKYVLFNNDKLKLGEVKYCTYNVS